MTNYTIQVTLKTFEGIFKPTTERFKFSLCAESRDEAIALASANVKTQGFPYDQKSVEVLDAIPMTTALVPYDPRFHKFDWTTVADAAQQAFVNECAAFKRRNEVTLASLREATEAVRELTRVLAA